MVHLGASVCQVMIFCAWVLCQMQRVFHDARLRLNPPNQVQLAGKLYRALAGTCAACRAVGSTLQWRYSVVWLRL